MPMAHGGGGYGGGVLSDADVASRGKDGPRRNEEAAYLEDESYLYKQDTRSLWLPEGAQDLVDRHPFTRRFLDKNPRFPGTVPPEALFCWDEGDFSTYIVSGGFVKPAIQCKYYISPENPQTIVDLIDPLLREKNWICSVDTHVVPDETVTQTLDFHGVPMHMQGKPDKAGAPPIFVWEGSRDFVDHEPTLRFKGLVNRITGLNCVTKVGMLEVIRDRCIERDPPISFPPPWFPLTFQLPDDLEQWKRHADDHPEMKWIYKPNLEAMGRGIILINSIGDVDSASKPFHTRCRDVKVFDPKEPPLAERHFQRNGVIQEYMMNPMLLENRKFAIRVYVLLARVKPYLAFVYNFGYVKRCMQEYDEDKFQREDLFRHITNQEFQKKNAEEFTPSQVAAEIMHIEALDKYLAENMGIPAFRLAFWQQVKQICQEVLLGCQEEVQEKGSVGQYEILGLDVIVDADQRVYLLEANRDPSWVTDTPVKKKLIPELVSEMLEIIFWAHGEEGKDKEAMLAAPMKGFEVLIDEQFDFLACNLDDYGEYD